MAALREAWDMPNGLPVPAPLIEVAAFFLRTESELVLKSRRVIPTRLLDAGFNSNFPIGPKPPKTWSSNGATATTKPIRSLLTPVLSLTTVRCLTVFPA